MNKAWIRQQLEYIENFINAKKRSTKETPRLSFAVSNQLCMWLPKINWAKKNFSINFGFVKKRANWNSTHFKSENLLKDRSCIYQVKSRLQYIDRWMKSFVRKIVFLFVIDQTWNEKIKLSKFALNSHTYWCVWYIVYWL